MRFRHLYNAREEEMEQLQKELRYLSRKYIAFLIYKGWTKMRRDSYDREIFKNLAKISKQEEII